MSKHFKMYITITDIIGEKRIDLAYPIWGKEVTTVTMFRDNIQYQIKEPSKVLLIMNKEKQLPKRVFTSRELNAFVARKIITTSLDTKENILKMNKLAGIMEMVISLKELENIDNLANGRLSNVLLRYYVTGSKEFKNFEPVTPQYKRLKNGSLIPYL